MTLRIALIASLRHGLREPHAGGLERHTADLAHQLDRMGHDVTVFASGEHDPDLRVEPIMDQPSQLDLSPAARKDVSMLSERFMAEHDAYLHLMLSLPQRGFDVVHDNSLHYLPVAMAGTMDAPLVKVLHTPPTPWLESALRRRSANTALVSVSHSNAASWADPVEEVIHNAVDLQRFTPVPAPRADRVVWAGRLCPEKAPHQALAAAHLADVALDVIGPASDARYVRRCVEPLLDDRRRWLGHADRAETAEAMANASVVLVTPDWPEPFGLVVAEALACGTPVAGYAIGALPELVTPDTGVLVAPGDVDALAAGIAQAAQLDRTACRRRAEQIGDLDRMAADYERLYTRLAAA